MNKAILKVMSKLRLRLLQKLVQAQDNKQIAPPPAFQASEMYPNIISGYNTATISIINQLVSIINTAVHYASDGRVNFQIFKNDSFNFDSSSAPSIDQKNLMNFSKKIFSNLLNSGAQFNKQLTGKEVSDIVDKLLLSQELQNLSSVSPTGILAQKIQGNLKTLITNYLGYIKSANPIK